MKLIPINNSNMGTEFVNPEQITHAVIYSGTQWSITLYLTSGKTVETFAPKTWSMKKLVHFLETGKDK